MPRATRPVLQWLGCLLVGAVLSLAQGQDSNWDLLHYHLYGPQAFWSGARDVAAAGMQGFFNPLVDMPYAALAAGPLAQSPRVLAACMGLSTGMVLWAAARIATLLHRGWLRWLAWVVAVSGVALVSQAGATTDEPVTAVLVLCGVLAVLGGTGWRRALLAGVLLGLAAGLKPNAAVFAPCLLLALGWRPGAWAAYGAGWAAGALLTGGWWAWRLWQLYANPVFPLFNGVFRSPWFPPENFVDRRFLPHGLLQWAFFPLNWALHPAALAAEVPAADPRLAATLLLFPAALLLQHRPRAERAALVFTASAYGVWLASSSIWRYAIPVEVMAGLCLPLLLRALSPRLALPGMAALALLAAAVTRYPSWGRIPFATPVLAAPDWAVPGTLAVVLTPPSSYLLRGVPAVGLLHTTLEARGFVLFDAAVARVAAHSGPITVLLRGDPALPHPELAELALNPSLGPCRLVMTPYETLLGGVQACQATKAEPPELRDPFWAAAARRYRRVFVGPDAWPFTGLGFLHSAGAAGRGMRFGGAGTLLGGFDPALPAVPDPDTLIVLGSGHVQPGPTDVVMRVDGVAVLAPGWRKP